MRTGNEINISQNSSFIRVKEIEKKDPRMLQRQPGQRPIVRRKVRRPKKVLGDVAKIPKPVTQQATYPPNPIITPSSENG